MKRALAARVKEEMGDPIIPPSAPPSSLPMGYAGMNGVAGGDGHPPSKIPRRTNMTMASAATTASTSSSLQQNHPDLPQSIVGGGGDPHSMASKKRPRNECSGTATGGVPPPNSSSSGNTSAYQSRKSSSDSKGTGRGPGRPRKSSVKHQDSSDEDEGDNAGFYLKQQNVSLASELYAYRRRIYLLERERDYRRKECRVAGFKIGELGGVWRGMESAIGKEFESNQLLRGQVGNIFVFDIASIFGYVPGEML